MYGLFGKFTAQPGKRDELATILLEAANGLRALEGCYLYVVNTDPADPDALWVNEVWRSQADHQASLSLEVTQTLIAAARPMIAGMSDRHEVTPLGGKGLPE